MGHPASLHLVAHVPDLTHSPLAPSMATHGRGATSMFNFFVIGIFTGFIYSLIALGYTLVYGTLRLINFAHSEVFICGAFGSYFFLREFMPTTPPPNGLSRSAGSSARLSLRGSSAALSRSCSSASLPAAAPAQRPAATYLISAIGASYFLVYFVGKEFGRFQSRSHSRTPTASSSRSGARRSHLRHDHRRRVHVMLVLLDAP